MFVCVCVSVSRTMYLQSAHKCACIRDVGDVFVYNKLVEFIRVQPFVAVFHTAHTQSFYAIGQLLHAVYIK